MIEISKLLHFLVVLLPYFLLMMKLIGSPIRIKNMHYLLLLYILIPYHWEFNDGKCILTEIQEKSGVRIESNSFIITYFGKYIKKLFDLLEIEYSEKNKDLFIYFNNMLSTIIIWYLIFYN